MYWFNNAPWIPTIFQIISLSVQQKLGFFYLIGVLELVGVLLNLFESQFGMFSVSLKNSEKGLAALIPYIFDSGNNCAYPQGG